ASRTRNRPVSVKLKFLATPESTLKVPGPTIVPLADVPKAPGLGAPNAATLNQLFTDRWSEDRFGFCRMFGRSVAVGTLLLLVYLVLVGSDPDQDGDRKKPVPQVVAAMICQPPTARFASRPRERNFFPRPNGSS